MFSDGRFARLQDDLSKSSTPRLSPSPQSTPPQVDRSSLTSSENHHHSQSSEPSSPRSPTSPATPPTPTSEEEDDDRSTARMETPPVFQDKTTSSNGGSRVTAPSSTSSASPRESPVGSPHHFQTSGTKSYALKASDGPAQKTLSETSPARDESRDAPVVLRNGGGLITSPSGPDGLNLTMKASELREMLRSRKKKDPRELQMDLRQKYKIIEQM